MKIKKDKKNIKKEKIASPMANHLRLPAHQLKAGQFGLAIDVRRPIEFFLNGEKYSGFHGDNLAAALLAAQQRFLASSLLYHRPRGMLADKFYESNGFVTIGNNHQHGFEPTVAVATLPLSNGLAFHHTRHTDQISSLEFFNETKEMGYAPAPLVNPAFQFLGKDKATNIFYDNQQHRHDVVVVGGGGDAAVALQTLLAKLGKAPTTVAVISNQPETITMAKMTAAIGKGARTIMADKRISWFFSTTAVTAKKLQPNNPDSKPDNKKTNESIVEILATQHHGKQATHPAGDMLWQERRHVFHCRAIILATGKGEQLLPFDNNDLPGVMGFGNAISLLKMYGVKPGHHAVVITNNDSIYQHLHYLHDAGVSLSAVVDIRKTIHPALMDIANDVGVEVYQFYYPQKARALYNQSTPSIFPTKIGRALKIMSRVVRPDNPSVASLSAVQQLDENQSLAPSTMDADVDMNMGMDATATASTSSSKEQVKNQIKSKIKNQLKEKNKKQKLAEAYIPPEASKIELARPDETDEALSAETEKIFNSDCLLVSGGFQPRLSLFTQLLPQEKSEADYLDWCEKLQAYVPCHWPEQVFLVGAVGGCFQGGDEQTPNPSRKKTTNQAGKKSQAQPIMAMGKEVAGEVVDFLQGKKDKKNKKTISDDAPRHHHHHGFTIMPHRFLPDSHHLGRNSFIDHQYDVKLENLHATFADGYHTPASLKHRSKLGFGFDRGLGGLSLGLAHLYGNVKIDAAKEGNEDNDTANNANENSAPTNKTKKTTNMTSSAKLATSPTHDSTNSTNSTNQPTNAAATMQNVIAHNNIFDELHGMAHPVAFGTLAHLPLDGRQFFNQTAIKGEMPFYPLLHRPKFFNIVMHPENNLNNDHGAQTTLENGKKIPNCYPYHEGDDADNATLEEKQNIMTGIGFADGSHIATINIIGKRAVDFLQFLSATKIANNKPGGVGGVTLLNPRDGFIIARGRYIIDGNGNDSVLLTLPLTLPIMTAPAGRGQIINLLHHLARDNKFSVAIIDSSEQWATLRLVGRGVSLLASQFTNDQLLEKTFGKNFTMPKNLSREDKEKLEAAARYSLIKNLPLNKMQELHWHGVSFLLTRRRFLPSYYLGGMVADIEITCPAHHAIALYKELWQSTVVDDDMIEAAAAAATPNKKSSAPSSTPLAVMMAAMGYQAFGLGRLAMDYWRLLKGDGRHGAMGEIDGTHSLHDYRLNDSVRSGKFVGRTAGSKDFLSQKNRPRLCGFIATMDNLDVLSTARHRGVISDGSIIQEIDQEPLAQGHGIGHITTASYCPIRKKYIGLGFVKQMLDPLSGKWKDRFGQEVMIADPLFKNYQRAIVVPYNQLALPEPASN